MDLFKCDVIIMITAPGTEYFLCTRHSIRHFKWLHLTLLPPNEAGDKAHFQVRGRPGDRAGLPPGLRLPRAARHRPAGVQVPGRGRRGRCWRRGCWRHLLGPRDLQFLSDVVLNGFNSGGATVSRNPAEQCCSAPTARGSGRGQRPGSLVSEMESLLCNISKLFSVWTFH